MLRTVLLPLAMVASLGVVSPASATRLEDTRVVPFNPGSLKNDAGVKSLQRRVATAVRQVCGSVVRRPIHEMPAYRDCVTKATADAHGQIDRAAWVARGQPSPTLQASIR